MDDMKLGVVEARFADIIWEMEPLSSGELVRICGEKLEWKKSTTYTVLKKLCQKGIFQKDHGMVSSLISKEEFLSIRSEGILNESFQGSLPAFIAAFTNTHKLSKKEINEIQTLIDQMEGE